MNIYIILVFICGEIFALPKNAPQLPEERNMHPHPEKFKFRKSNAKASINAEEYSADFWNTNAQAALKEKFSKELNKKQAKNVIMFLGDGMSIPTLAAARVYLGGEEKQLSFEKFPYTALSKTYCVDYQVADSACSATAYLGGVKGNMDTIGVTAAVKLNDCVAMVNASNHVGSIATWSQQNGKKTGLVTTTRVTHASPSGLYAHIANRNWENDAEVTSSGKDPLVCRDIAYQLVNNDPGKNFNVIFGGGRRQFLQNDTVDEQGQSGSRTDGENLIEKWLSYREEEGQGAEYVWNREQLLAIKDNTEYALGLFATSHVPYNLDRNQALDPSLEEMTEAAIKILSKNSENGFFLFVEGGRIDHAHHDALAKKSFDETAEFSKAIQKAVDLTSEEDTLIVVTSDHAHTMSISGYPERYNNILGFQGRDTESLAALTINYANGPGFKPNNEDGSRYDLESDDTTDNNYQFPGVFPLDLETHGGDDVAIFARGPWAHLFQGVMEQNVIPHIMAFASCVNDGYTACKNNSNSIFGSKMYVAVFYGFILDLVLRRFL